MVRVMIHKAYVPFSIQIIEFILQTCRNSEKLSLLSSCSSFPMLFFIIMVTSVDIFRMSEAVTLKIFTMFRVPRVLWMLFAKVLTSS